MVVNDKLNLTMLCDFYELTMSQGYFASGYKDRIAYFDLFFRRCPDGGGFAIAAGLEQFMMLNVLIMMWLHQQLTGFCRQGCR